MGDVYHHPVFFEVPGLLEEQKEKRIETYFRIQRKSGGGDCGALERLSGQTYRVAFNDPKAQQAVLQRREHVVDGLVFSVRGSREAPSSSASQDSTAPLQSPECIPDSTPSPSGEEYELRPDSHLLRYLKECPKAVKELQEALTSVACSVQLYPEDGRALVSRLAQAGAAVRNWKSEVDKLFDGYMCHYEVDPHKAKALLQACSSRQTTDEVKVYSEVGISVVVGERSQVNAMLMAVEDSHVKRRAGYSEKQTIICRLGKAKLRLLWKDMERSLRQDFPEVTVTEGAAGQLVLEGSAEEILKAEDFISAQENAVLERTVSDMSLHLLAFLRKAYGGPGFLGDFLGLGGKVEIELRDTEVSLLSLSTDALDETVKALQGEIKEVNIGVPNCFSVPSDLREELKSKTNEMNQGQYRAQVVFGPDSTVCLLGHTKEVEELREGVIQFLDESRTVYLPFTELAQELPELLQLHGFDYSGVTFHPKTSSSGSMVVLEGPSDKVAEVRNWLGLYLDSLLEDIVPTDQLGTVSYSQSPTGNDEFPNVARDLASACDRPLQGRSKGNATPRDLGFQGGATGGAPEDGVHVENIQGTMETQQTFRCVQEDAHQPHQVSNRRIVILGKTGVGKSSVANTIFGEELVKIGHNFNSDTKKCQAATKYINGRNITLIDTPGFFDTDRSEEELKSEIVKSIIEFAPGPHAFLIVLKVEKYTEQEQAVITKINQYFSEEVFKYATVLFTHGDQIPEGQTIEDCVRDNELVRDLVKKCGGRCHVIDNKYWKNNQQEGYRSNQFQVEELLKTIDKMVEANKGRCYTNEMLQVVEEGIQQEMQLIRQSPGNMSEVQIREEAKDRVSKWLFIILAGFTAVAMLGALFGVGGMVSAVSALKAGLPFIRSGAAVLAMKAMTAGQSSGL